MGILNRCFLCAVVGASTVAASGVAIVNGASGTYFTCNSSSIAVSVENQAAVTRTTQVFRNSTASATAIKYAFPLPEQASALQLRWLVGAQWYKASIAATPQDTTTPGGGGNKIPSLETYLGKTPLYFSIGQAIPLDSTITIELTYVEFSKYDNGKVGYTYPNDYRAIQAKPFTFQDFRFSLSSKRTITDIRLEDLQATSQSNTGTEASVTYIKEDVAADRNYSVTYSLSLKELGLFDLSTRLPDTLMPDKGGNGYFLFIVEPDPSAQTHVIQKIFTLIIDRSGSMGGDKIVQARNAATFIVNNLNQGDKFNIVDFDDVITCFRPAHVEFNADNRSAALQHIAGLTARNSTNISGAFDVAIPQFAASATEATANIVIFFTDGQPTAGLTAADAILSKIDANIKQVNKRISIFTFGIGGDVNRQLLSLIAQRNNGLSEFLDNDQLEGKITGFYLKIRNPVLLKTQVAFSPAVISEVFPQPLPDLYKGEQLVVVGRYASTVPVEATFSGEAFGQPASYNYAVKLAEGPVETNQFIPKIWAKRKIDNLLAIYHTLNPASPQAKEYKTEITAVSMHYGVISPFTSFSGGNPTPIEKKTSRPSAGSATKTLSVVRVRNGGVRFSIRPAAEARGAAIIKIFNSTGKLVKTVRLGASGAGMYEAVWDGIMENGGIAPNDVYFCVVIIGSAQYTAKLVLVR